MTLENIVICELNYLIHSLKRYNMFFNKFLATCKAWIGDGSGSLGTGIGSGSGKGNALTIGTGTGSGTGNGNGTPTGTGRITFALAPIAKHNKQATKIYWK